MSASPDNWKTIEELLPIWLGVASESFPMEREELLVAKVGRARAQSLLPVFEQLVGEFFQSEAADISANQAEMERTAIDDFLALHPEAPARVCQALAWLYTFSNR